MKNLRATWAAMRPASRALAVGGLAVILVAVVGIGLALGGAFGGTGGQAGEVPGEPEPTAQSFPPGETPPALPAEPTPAASLEPEPSATPPSGPSILGTDGRFTVLMLGSDYRPAHPGNRTDAIMVASIDPVTGQTAAFSIPRDTINFPLPGGGVFSGKVNALYQHLLATSKNGNEAMKRAISKAFGVELDGFVFIGFEGVRRMVDAVGGVTVTLDKPYFDAEYWVNARTQGWGLPAGSSHLNGKTALIFARSRKGDSDFGRARRQQQLVMAALAKVRDQGPTALPKLLRIAGQTVRTDLPASRVRDIYDVVSRAKLDTAKRVVFGPRTYTNELGGSAFSPDLKVCRAWIAKNFPPARNGATWPPTETPAPSGSAAPSVTPAP